MTDTKKQPAKFALQDDEFDTMPVDELRRFCKALTSENEAIMAAAKRARAELDSALTAPERAEAVQATGDGDYPECSGDPASCPENEGRGCCMNYNPVQPIPATPMGNVRRIVSEAMGEPQPRGQWAVGYKHGLMVALSIVDEGLRAEGEVSGD